jgi:hypothetical protein
MGVYRNIRAYDMAVFGGCMSNTFGVKYRRTRTVYTIGNTIDSGIVEYWYPDPGQLVE